MSRYPHSPTRVAALVALAIALASGPGFADEWLVYIGGGLEAIEGGWEERKGLVIFTMRGGTLVSIPFQDVDLPASAVITWQLGGRRRVPPRASLPESSTQTDSDTEHSCISARILAVDSGETLQVEIDDERETVHLACLDTPETQHRFAELAWFGRATLSAVQLAVKPGAEVCLTETRPPLRDNAGHRIVFVSLADGSDYTEAVIFGGLGMLRPESCGRAAYYRQLENRAIAEQRGLWGPMSQRAAFMAANHAPAVSGGGGPPARASGGG